MNGKQVAVIGSVLVTVAGTAWAFSVASPVLYGAAPASWWNNLQTLAGSLLGGGGAITTIVLILKKLGVPVPDNAGSAVEKLLDDYRKGKMIDVAEDTVLISAMTFRVKAKDPIGIELATKLMQHVMVDNAGKQEPAK